MVSAIYKIYQTALEFGNEILLSKHICLWSFEFYICKLDMLDLYFLPSFLSILNNFAMKIV